MFYRIKIESKLSNDFDSIFYLILSFANFIIASICRNESNYYS